MFGDGAVCAAARCLTEYQLMGSGAEELLHDQGHVVPLDPAAIAAIAAFLRLPSLPDDAA
jgi:hypothetical protein